MDNIIYFYQYIFIYSVLVTVDLTLLPCVPQKSHWLTYNEWVAVAVELITLRPALPR